MSTKLRVHEIFESVQFEGPFCGTPAVFIRLHGCPQKCSFCDTPQDLKNYSERSLVQLYKEIIKKDREKGIHLAVLTGGEPLFQDSQKLINFLSNHYKDVQIETSGVVNTAFFNEFSWYPQNVTFVVSPKKDSLQIDDLFFHNKKIVLKILVGSSSIKFEKRDLHYIKNRYSRNIYFQPIEKGGVINPDDIRQSIAWAKEFGGKISVQVHKFLNLK